MSYRQTSVVQKHTCPPFLSFCLTIMNLSVLFQAPIFQLLMLIRSSGATVLKVDASVQVNCLEAAGLPGAWDRHQFQNIESSQNLLCETGLCGFSKAARRKEMTFTYCDYILTSSGQKVNNANPTKEFLKNKKIKNKSSTQCSCVNVVIKMWWE